MELFDIPALESTALTVDPAGRFVYLARDEPGTGGAAPDTHGIVLVQNWLSRFTQ